MYVLNILANTEIDDWFIFIASMLSEHTNRISVFFVKHL